ncbi:MAG: hypothetical protein NT027_08325 [Proteobacteria bacterium]|nr:hypothetical protein [Pseudomonadota bacterium]
MIRARQCWFFKGAMAAGIANAASFATPAIAGATGPTVGNPEVNEASEEPSQRPGLSSRKVASPLSAGVSPYGLVDARHVTTDYFSADQERERRDTSVHGNMQLGMRMYQDKLDLSFTAGAVKLPASQAFYQKRPELLADVYLYRSESMNLLWYNSLQVPVREKDRDPTEFVDSDLWERDSLRGIDASIYKIGLAPSAKYDWRMWGGKYAIRGGAEAWTKMYSKPLYIDESNSSGGEGVGLLKLSSDTVDKPFEDRAMRYVHQESVAIVFNPSIVQGASIDLGAHIESRYLPQYFKTSNEEWDLTRL